jgi:1,2-diacylglycerol 3-alpha-glucosyltransferase
VRIAIFTNTYWPTVNGVAVSIGNLRDGLTKLGHDVYIFAPAPADFDTDDDQPNVFRFPSVAAPVEADYPLAVPYSQAAARALREVRFDLIHTQHPVWVGVWGQWCARWTGTPLVTTVHTQYEIYSKMIPLPDAVVDAFLKVRVSSYCNRCHIVTTPAQSSRERLLAQGVTVPIEVVYNPTDLTECLTADGAEVRAQYGLDPGSLVLGYVGRLAPEKNLDTFLTAADRVMREDSRVRCLIVGDGPSRDKLEQMARGLPTAQRIIFTGSVPHERVALYQAAIDIFLTASLFEVQPLSFAEAMATGTPVIAMDAPGANDMIRDGHNGCLVPPDDGAGGLADATFRVLQDPATLPLMAAQAREWASRYDRPVVVERMLEIYDRAISLAAQERR